MTPARAFILRAALAGVGLLIATAFSYRYWIRPLEVRHAETVAKIEEVRERFRANEREVTRIHERQKEGPAIRSALASLHDNLPADPVVVWLPSRVRTMLGRFGVAGVDVRLNRAVPERLLPEFERTTWLVSVPMQPKARKLTDILLAVAQIEQQDNFVQIDGLSLRVDSEEPGGTTGYLNLTAFLPK